MMQSRVTDYEPIEWTEMWIGDHKEIERIMYQNMMDDINAGYDINGAIIAREKQEIAEYHDNWTRQMSAFAAMDEKTCGRWCFYDMKKRGVID